MTASFYSSLEVIEKLLTLKADANILNNYGSSALSVAFKTENISAITTLLKQKITNGIEKCVEALGKPSNRKKKK